MKNTFWLFILLVFLGITAQGQRGSRGPYWQNLKIWAVGGGAAGNIEKRKSQEDSITITYRYLDTARNYKLDSSLNDFTVEFPIPATHYHLGNTGSATQSYLFSPLMNAGLMWDCMLLMYIDLLRKDNLYHHKTLFRNKLYAFKQRRTVYRTHAHPKPETQLEYSVWLQVYKCTGFIQQPKNQP